MSIAFICLVLVCMYTRVLVCVHAHIHMSQCMCECVCDSPSLKYFMLLSFVTVKIFPKDKILILKSYSPGIGEQSGYVCRRQQGKKILVVAMLFSDLGYLL